MIQNTNPRIFALIALDTSQSASEERENYKAKLSEWGLDKEETESWSTLLRLPVVAFDDEGYPLAMRGDGRLGRPDEWSGFIRVTTGAEVISEEEARALMG